MFPFILLKHHEGFRLERENLKRKIQNNLDSITNLLVELNNIITKQEASYSHTFGNELGQTYIENLKLKHAKDHLNAFEQTGQNQQKDATINALNE